MRLKLKNFRQHANYELNIPDKGLVLLKGVSGSGKSTILDAFFDTLYGGVTKVKPWSGGAPAVELELNNPKLYAKRTHTPNTMMVKIGEHEFRDDAAEAEIVKAMGMTKEEFLAASYIRQRMAGSLLRLGPADQLRFIQSLSFGGDDPEVLREKIAAFINQAKANVQTRQFAVEDAENNLKQAQSKLEEAKKNPNLTKPDAPFSEEEVTQIETAYSGAQNQDQQIRALIAEIDGRLANPLRKKLTQFEATQELLTKNITDSETKISAWTQQLSDLPIPFQNKSSSQYMSEMALVQPKKKYIMALADAQAVSAQVSQKFGTQGPAGQALKEIINKYETAIETLDFELASAKTDHRDFLKYEEGEACPECGTKLLMKDGKLHKHGDVINREELVATLNKKIEKIVSKRDAERKTLAEAKELLIRVESLKEILKTDPIPSCKTLDELEDFAARMTAEYTEQTRLVEQRKNLAAQIDSEKKTAEANKISLSVAQAEAEKARKLKPTELLEAERAQAWTSLTAIQGLIQKLNQQIAKISEYKNQINLWESEIKVVKMLDNLVNEATSKLLAAKQTHEEALADLGAWTRVKELSDLAAAEAIEGTIADINQNAQNYLTALFPDDGTIVRILNASKNKKGDLKPKLSLDIIHKGQEAGKDINELSGGEQDRVVLAFQLAMSDLYGSPVLFVDEGFAGADVEKTLMLGLEVLKEISQNKLVVMVQHGVPEGIFDEVIQL